MSVTMHFIACEFTWDKDVGSAFASDLGLRDEWPGKLSVQSHKTGRVLEFRFCGTAASGNEITYRSYVATHEGKMLFIRVYNT